jgi:hypothetical protein
MMAAAQPADRGGLAMTPRDRRVWHRDRRFWYGAVAAIIVLLLIIGWTLGWFGGDAPPAVTPTTG